MAKNILKSCQPKIYGIDLTNRVKEAPALCAVADCRNLPFADNTFDIVYSLGVVEHFPETKIAIYEHCRVLKPGGYFFLTTPHLSLGTFAKFFQYAVQSQWKMGTFEVVRGRNLKLKFVKDIIQDLPIKIIFLEGCGVRKKTSPLNKAIKSIFPDCFLHTHLILGAKKNNKY